MSELCAAAAAVRCSSTRRGAQPAAALTSLTRTAARLAWLDVVSSSGVLGGTEAVEVGGRLGGAGALLTGWVVVGAFADVVVVGACVDEWVWRGGTGLFGPGASSVE